ncbi:MAG: AAA family ATPase [Gammaproteobacteria bacterium]
MAAKDSQDYLIRGSDYLTQKPDFRLVGRDDELKKLSRILMRSSANSVLLVGPGGVGCTALCLGLQAAKREPETPFDIVNKRIFWLDTDGLFSSGDIATMNENFQKLLRRLSRYPETLLIVEDMRDFIEATRNNGCTNFINALMREIERGRFQAIFETRDEDLEVVLKCHSNMNEYYTMLDLHEPDGTTLRLIVREAVNVLERHHQIPVDPGAIDAAIDLTSKYRVREMSLSRAQPERSLNLLDRAFATYRQAAHARPPGLDEKEAEIAEVTTALESDSYSGYLAGQSKEELKRLLAGLGSDIDGLLESWKATQDELRKLQKNRTDGEETLRSLENQLEEQRRKDGESRDRMADDQSGADASGKTRDQEFRAFNMRAAAGGYESEPVNELKADIAKVQTAIEANSAKFRTLTAGINAHLQLVAEHVLLEFSEISGIPASKLNQDERAKLLNLDKALAARVFGQDHAIKKLADAVRVARVGLRDSHKPQASFMFLGPSGVGKTEIAKALTAVLHDDERALLRFDMSEYMEKHAVAKLIGAPPGYEGYEAGGILTNAMRRNPYVVILFDEIEKAHPDVFNVFLQVLDDGRLTDNRGLTVSFGDAVIIMTTNIGQTNFLDESMSFEDAARETINDLEKYYRPEFLNRFNGRQNIVCFNSLDLPVIERIARREIDKLNSQISAQGHDLSIELSEQSLVALCRDHYNPTNGARGIPGYFASNIHPAVANTILLNQQASGVMEVVYEEQNQELSIVSPRGGDSADKKPTTHTA